MPCLWNLFRILGIQWTDKDQEHNLFQSSLAFGEVSNIKKDTLMAKTVDFVIQKKNVSTSAHVLSMD